MPISLKAFEKGDKINIEIVNGHGVASSLRMPDGRIVELSPIPFIFEEIIIKRLNNTKNEALDASEIREYLTHNIYKNIKSTPYEMTSSILDGQSPIEKILYCLSSKNKIEIRKISKNYFYAAK